MNQDPVVLEQRPLADCDADPRAPKASEVDGNFQRSPRPPPLAETSQVHAGSFFFLVFAHLLETRSSKVLPSLYDVVHKALYIYAVNLQTGNLRSSLSPGEGIGGSDKVPKDVEYPEMEAKEPHPQPLNPWKDEV